MPTYQYACTAPSCASRFELVQSFTDPNASECPICAGPVRKVFSAVGVVFKGSGFYRNDSRKAAGKHGDSESATKSEPSKSTPAAVSDDSSNSSKPAEKSSSSSGDGSSSAGNSSNGKSKSQSGTSPAAASA
ncbi:MAG: FmdB family transcriptional regulator [Pseudonocardiales bacterium]|nr:MAG: FmdB family transcriptional regulator [Pseudonocardiales bacterium]